MIFLIHYDRTTREVKKLLEFIDKKSASEKKLALEIELIGENNGHEVVILEADNREDLAKTHNRYFAHLKDIKIEE